MKFPHSLRSLAFILGGVLLIQSSLLARENVLVFIGTYTGPKSKGIYVSRLDSDSGHLSNPELVAETPNPTFLALHPNKKFLYAANEIANFAGGKAGAVSAFAIDAKTGQLKLLNQTSSVGDGPCHLVVDKTGGNVLLANYGGGSVAVLPIKADGSTAEHSNFIQHTGSSVNPQRQKEPHAHSINLSPDNRLAFAADLGLDKVLIYAFDAKAGKLTPNNPAFATLPPGSGPRHFAFHPNGRFAYVISEMLSTLTSFTFDAGSGALTSVQTVSTLPAGFSGNSSTAEVVVHPSGKFVYGSNRGHDSIAVFSIDEKNNHLTLIENTSTQGKVPRNFNIDPSGKFLLAGNQSTDNIAVFRIDPKTGRLTPTGQSISVGAPVCLKFLATP
jgi:6-phosphogluconolactonase